ncbi:DNA internalization-related competence protein ComEC/Rec2 [Legionella clemsonensis]|uniref:ComEC family competence protein n=1 Tax=Legionella clemsonensis TaxID=1867846 RepID=A0A222P393_9GAMM|nr:DNA internalization-related competence protein ComEC/Rec2 [Legionella clemsonensis]ASQ46301.1 ComEC family competence protein [Legionella clemsonensis]
MEILCFFAGTVFFYTKSVYAILLVVVAFFLSPRLSFPCCFLAALLWGYAHQWWVADCGMPMHVRIIPHAVLEGEIVSIPATTTFKSQFQFKLSKFNGKPASSILLLACYNRCPLFKVGESWRFEAKIKKPANLGNPGSFNYVNWLSARHIHWVGYIKPRTATLLKPGQSSSLLRLREQLASTLDKLLPEGKSLGIFEALTLGITNHIDKSQWELFRRTGTTHLMVISGAHIGLVAGLGFMLMRWLWTRNAWLCLHYPAPQAASIAGLLMAIAYALLAGFAPPAQRSLIACFLLLSRNFSSYRFTGWQAWRYGLLAVLLFEPHDVLLPGFYLSFLAVASLLLGSQRLRATGFKKSLGLQLICLFGLMPLTLFWFSYGAISGLLANLVAIPFVGFVIVPAALISLLAVQCWDEAWFLIPVHWAIEVLLYFLKLIDSLASFNLSFSFSSILSPLALMLVMLSGLFLPVRAFYPAMIVLGMAALYPGYPKVRGGEAEINILDVGQGLAVTVRTANHTLVYDTGMKFYQGGDMAKLAIIPFLKTVGIKKIDKIIISHPDLDHRGGLVSLETNYPVNALLVNNISYYRRGENCHYYPSWQWDGISFRFLAIHKRFKNKNNNSCILQIGNSRGRILLTGDIERSAEDYLVKMYKEQLASEVLVVPHHGSKTSSSPSFIQQISPKFAVISAGFDNRYHFPHAQTLQTFARQNVKILSTADCGMVTVRLPANHDRINPFCYKTITSA